MRAIGVAKRFLLSPISRAGTLEPVPCKVARKACWSCLNEVDGELARLHQNAAKAVVVVVSVIAGIRRHRD